MDATFEVNLSDSAAEGTVERTVLDAIHSEHENKMKKTDAVRGFAVDFAKALI